VAAAMQLKRDPLSRLLPEQELLRSGLQKLHWFFQKGSPHFCFGSDLSPVREVGNPLK